ncbi:hypothetical protein [Colwellia sp. UCD-KL20]|uniref:GapS4b family protein n=1 Tax=Colwellia sp. UCD-KL20 TaxID=1917165 RepID=UPI0009713949|nr:hypothetical protein [Colwellia sp. UCD-KL20]
MNNTKYILPYGDTLRDYLNDSSITKSELRSIIRRRGVFVAVEEKSSYVPLLVRTGLTPCELQELQESIITKEENPKRQTQSVKCKAGSQSLISSLPLNYKISEVAKKPFSNYKVLGSPSFKPVDNNPDFIELNFTVERYDHTQNWVKNTTQFSGKVKLQKKNDNLDINISLSHTSPETKEVANKIVTDVIKQLKSNNCIEQNESVNKIRFKDFSNEDRIIFLNKLSQDNKEYELNFRDTKDIGFSPDPSDNFPDEISWMQKDITNLALQGKSLHSTVFFRNKSFHKHIQIHKIEASYTFDYSGKYYGSCNITYEFPEFSTKNDVNAELIIKVTNVRFRDNKSGISQSKMKEILLSPKFTSKCTTWLHID